jgi:hypothetical protein
MVFVLLKNFTNRVFLTIQKTNVKIFLQDLTAINHAEKLFYCGSIGGMDTRRLALQYRQKIVDIAKYPMSNFQCSMSNKRKMNKV